MVRTKARNGNFFIIWFSYFLNLTSRKVSKTGFGKMRLAWGKESICIFSVCQITISWYGMLEFERWNRGVTEAAIFFWWNLSLSSLSQIKISKIHIMTAFSWKYFTRKFPSWHCEFHTFKWWLAFYESRISKHCANWKPFLFSNFFLLKNPVSRLNSFTEMFEGLLTSKPRQI